ncbi:MAG: DUF4240 domain-containing protein [Clostridiales bacterium]|jgi:hypothetical protein|nr:DUF4240 domain-containing protein [Clostridiales bacterium]
MKKCTPISGRIEKRVSSASGFLEPLGSDTKQEEVMNKNQFWAIMEKAKDIDTEIMSSKLTEEITNLSKQDAQMFNNYINAYIDLINETIWIDMACKVINGYVSDDTGLYFTLWLMSQGETVLLKAVSDPDTLSELPKIPFGNADFEMLMGIGAGEDEEIENESIKNARENAHEKILQEITPSIKFKDGEQYGKYETFDDAMEDIPNILPKLIKRAEMEQFDWKEWI